MTQQLALFKAMFPNFDIETSLLNLGNNTTLLQKVIESFYLQYKDSTITDLTLFFNEKRIEDATRLAHTIKGLSGTIGAIALQKNSLALEIACKESDDCNIKETFLTFCTEFEKTIHEINCGLQQLSAQGQV